MINLITILKKIHKKIKCKIQTRKNRLVFYVWNPSEDYRLNILDNDINFKIVTNFNDYVELCSKKSIEINKNATNRFLHGATFACLVNNKDIITSGWLIGNCERFPVSEIDSYINIPVGICVLFDFNTTESYRNKGYYSKLLNYIKHCIKSKLLIIYALEDNIASRKGIEKSGFCIQGIYKHNSKSYRKMMNSYGIEIVNNKMF